MTSTTTTTCDYPGCTKKTTEALGANSMRLHAARIIYAHGAEESGEPQAQWWGHLCGEHSSIVRRKLKEFVEGLENEG